MRAKSNDLTPGILDGCAKRAFKFGDCDVLAIALHDATGWPLVKVTDSWNVHSGHAGDGSALHWMVRHPSGKLLDVDGLHDEEDVLRRYHAEADPPDDEVEGGGRAAVGIASRADAMEEYYDRKGGSLPLKLVRTFVKPVLRAAGLRGRGRRGS